MMKVTFILLEEDQNGQKLVRIINSFVVQRKIVYNYTIWMIETQTPGLEPSLADLQQKALFLDRSTLSDLEDLGQGLSSLLNFTNA